MPVHILGGLEVQALLARANLDFSQAARCSTASEKSSQIAPFMSIQNGECREHVIL